MDVFCAAEWKVARPEQELDPARYLGELGALPPAARPGDWCTVVLADDDGQIRFTLVAYESLGNALSRDAATRFERVAERMD